LGIIGRLAKITGILEVRISSVPSDTALGEKDLILSSKFTPNHTETVHCNSRLEQGSAVAKEFWRYFEVV
jgi:hypothetical protein